MSFRPIPDVKLERAAPAVRGCRPDGIIWVTPAELVIDTRYQRDLGRRGVGRVRDIAMGFDWRKFTPLIVAAHAEGGYAVIDGQHRAAAVLARGDIAAIPAWLVDADVLAQAETFLAINAQSARVPSGAMVFARAAAGDPQARQLLVICDEAGLEILKHPLGALERAPNQTDAPLEIARQMTLHGAVLVRRSLKLLCRAGTIASRCFLTQRMIRAAVLILKHNPAWSDAAVAAALVRFKVDAIEAKAVVAAREKGGSRQEHFLKLTHDYLAQHIAAAA